MDNRRLDNRMPGPEVRSAPFRGQRPAAIPTGGLAAVLILAAGGFAAAPENLAPQAQVSATSEYSADYAARFAVDGIVPEALGHSDTAQAWCINRKQAGDQAEFTLRWKQPVEAAEIVYFGRTAQLLSECWKDYEIYLDGEAKPAAKGTFQMVHGPQRVPLERRRVQQVRLKFDRVCRKLGLTADEHLLEIGSGWGGFAVHAAGQYGCRVTTTTISRKQYEYTRQRVAAAGLADRVTVLGEDYRVLQGSFRVVQGEPSGALGGGEDRGRQVWVCGADHGVKWDPRPRQIVAPTVASDYLSP